MKEDWTKKLNTMLAGHQATPPTGLWEAVSEQMGLAPEPAQRTVFLPRLWRWGVAAAVVLALVGLFAWYKFPTNSPIVPTAPSGSPMRGNDLALANNAEKEATEPVIIEKKTDQTYIAKAEPVRSSQTVKAEPASIVVEDTDAVLSADVISVPTDTASSVAVETERQNHPVRNTERLVATKTLPLADEQERTVAELKKDKSPRLSIGLDGSGMLAQAQTLHREDRIYYACSRSEYDAPSGTQQTFYAITDYVTKHYLPVRFGVNLQYQLTRRLSLTTGLHYIYLHSRFTIPLYDQTLREQHLHYLGIPLGVGCQLWSNAHFQVYVSGGAMVEKCLNERPWQWSVYASAGAEYLFHRMAGLYLEPSLGYYFDDGTSLRHYYKEHPLTPSIEVGLRVHLSK